MRSRWRWGNEEEGARGGNLKRGGGGRRAPPQSLSPPPPLLGCPPRSTVNEEIKPQQSRQNSKTNRQKFSITKFPPRVCCFLQNLRSRKKIIAVLLTYREKRCIIIKYRCRFRRLCRRAPTFCLIVCGEMDLLNYVFRQR